MWGAVGGGHHLVERRGGAINLQKICIIYVMLQSIKFIVISAEIGNLALRLQKESCDGLSQHPKTK